jgi:AcrR family transcriptional regulator
LTWKNVIHILNYVKHVGTAERRARHQASLRREILDAASKLFVEEGYDRVTMRRIASRIEYSPTTIYLHFKDKAELFNAVCEETFSLLAGKLDTLKRMRVEPVGHLRECLRLYVDFGVKHPDHYAVTFLQAPRSGQTMPFESPIHGRALDALRQAVRSCVDNADIRTADVDLTAQALWAAIHGLTALLITSRGFPPTSQAALVDHTVDTLIAGLRPPPSPARTYATPPPRTSTFTD